MVNPTPVYWGKDQELLARWARALKIARTGEWGDGKS